MQSCPFAKLIPGGNPTVILEEPALGDSFLADVAARLMSPLHVGGEQVGALYGALGENRFSGRPLRHIPRLEMMGGEFCVNAARSAAFLLARQGRLAPLPCAAVRGGRLAVSGAAEPVLVLAASDAESLRKAMKTPGLDEMLSPATPVTASSVPLFTAPDAAKDCPAPGASPAAALDAALLHCAARVRTDSSAARQVHRGLWKVNLPGITHLLADSRVYRLPETHDGSWRKESAALRLLGGVADEPASGVIWFESRGDGRFNIVPAVEVKATASEHLESACGSASLALALALEQGLAETDASAGEGVPVVQPSGETLLVLPEKDREDAGASRAWIAGPVRLAAQGVLYL